MDKNNIPPKAYEANESSSSVSGTPTISELRRRVLMKAYKDKEKQSRKKS